VRGKGLTHVANAVARSADHVASFFVMLRLELAFYLGCVNLYERLEQAGQPTCFPDPSATPAATLDARGIYDVCLALQLGGGVVGNDVRADGKPLVMITGANQGGKSTLLRALGVAQLMMQAGMFVGAEALRADVSTGVFTHFKRSEDAALKQGKLDEELSRMRAIADDISPGCVLLCNESFASTNEREGSEIARNVVRAMLDKRIKVLFVTHMYDLAHGFDEEGSDTTLFVRADRRDDGRRTFKLLERPPLPTSYGADSFERVFGEQVPPAVEVPRTTA
jgi:DNA mismatch repair ATPase MutS